MNKQIKNLIGQKFGRWTVLEYKGVNKHHNATWLCECVCGTKRTVRSGDLMSGRSKSCGCDGTNHRTHGQSNTRLFRIWANMKTRCYLNTKPDYKYYGGRGITICDEWKNDFQVFYDWAMCHGYREDLTIDRINVNGNYEPSNCRWVDMKTQNKNKRNVNGK